MKVTLDTKLCNGCGMCPILCPEAFRMVEHPLQRFAVVHSETVPAAAMECFNIARDCCKRGAIRTIAAFGTKPQGSRKVQVTCVESQPRGRVRSR